VEKVADPVFPNPEQCHPVFPNPEHLLLLELVSKSPAVSWSNLIISSRSSSLPNMMCVRAEDVVTILFTLLAGLDVSLPWIPFLLLLANGAKNCAP